MLFSYEICDHEMHLKSIASLVMMILLLGVSTSALQNSVFAQTSSASDSDNDITKRLGEIPKDKFKQETKNKFKQETRDNFKQEAREDLRNQTPRPNCNPEDSDHARRELGTIEQRYGEIKAKYYEEWQKLHESGEYDGPWETFAQEHFLNSPELSEMKNIREKYSEVFRNCNDARETRPYPVSPNDVREVNPYPVSPTNTRIDCNQDDYLHAKKELAALEQRYGSLKEKYYQEWQRMHQSGEYDGSWDNFAKEHFMNSPDMAGARQIHEKYSEFLRHCNHVTDARPNPTEPTTPTSDNNLTNEPEDDASLDNNVADDLNEETTLSDDLDKLLTEIELTSVPESIKDDAAWWVDNQIADSEFASSIEYLASQNAMELAPPGPDSSPHIPAWVKAIAAWWAEGKIPDNEFVNAIRFLADHGIIKV